MSDNAVGFNDELRAGAFDPRRVRRTRPDGRQLNDMCPTRLAMLSIRPGWATLPSVRPFGNLRAGSEPVEGPPTFKRRWGRHDH